MTKETEKLPLDALKLTCIRSSDGIPPQLALSSYPD